jgi:hypothetical protein
VVARAGWFRDGPGVEFGDRQQDGFVRPLIQRKYLPVQLLERIVGRSILAGSGHRRSTPGQQADERGNQKCANASHGQVPTNFLVCCARPGRGLRSVFRCRNDETQ